jgi:formylglycine-generating enzyme required for sulfatase activity
MRVPDELYTALGLILLACGSPETRDASSATKPSAAPTASAATRGSAVPAPSTAIPTTHEDGEMVLVPAGSFVRGSPPGIGTSDEHPRRDIELSAFYIDRTEVTQRAYSKCIEATQCEVPSCKTDTDFKPGLRASHPVVCVDWNDARTYCAWMHKRLPTEAEWEKAARGSDARLYPWGNEPPACDKANYRECERHSTVDVGTLTKGASPYGALDMAGNVWEWTADWHENDYYAKSPAKDPKGPDTSKEKVVRGGAWSYSETELLSAGRIYDDPTVRYGHVGFRCARDATGD